MKELELIKKYYGERTAHKCRELFPTILEEEGKLFSIINENFGHTHFLIDDLENDIFAGHFKNYIYNLIDDNSKMVTTDKTPFELMDEAGYTLFECKSEEDIQKFKKYYAEKEELCTFRTNRLKTAYVFFAVKKNVEDIKREDFTFPSREDFYGTSVISIQFSRGDNNILSIKNRYNHIVENPDATFSNNLDNIIPGLTDSFEKEFSLNITNRCETDFLSHFKYKRSLDNKFYKYNIESDNVYYGPNNVVISNDKIKEEYLDKSRYIVMDNFVLDLKEKKFVFGESYLTDDFRTFFEKKKFSKIEVIKEGKEKRIIFTFGNNRKVFIIIDKTGQIVEYKNKYIKKISNYFMKFNRKLRNLEIPNIEIIGNEFMRSNNELKSFSAPKLISIGKDFMRFNFSLATLELPNLEIIDDGFLIPNNVLEEINLPNVKIIKNDFMLKNSVIKHIFLPKVKKIGNFFLHNCKTVSYIEMPNVQYISDDFIANNANLKSISLPNLISVGRNFISENVNIEQFYMPNLEIIDAGFLLKNRCLQEIKLPKSTKIGDYFLKYNQIIKKIYIPLLIECGSNFLCSNIELDEFIAPQLEIIGHNFMCYNNKLEKFEAPNLEQVNTNFLICNTTLKYLSLPKLTSLPDRFLENNQVVVLNIPNASKAGVFCLLNHPEKDKIMIKLK